MALSFIIKEHILDLFLLRIWLDTYVLILSVYLILLNKMYRNLNPMLETELLSNLRKHLYLPHLNLLLYFTPDNHNGELVRRHLLLQPILEPHQITPLSNELLQHTSHLLPQPPHKNLPDLLIQLIYLGLHNRPNHYLILHPTLLCLGRGR